MSKSKKDFLAYAAIEANINADYAITKKLYTIFPFVDKVSGEVLRCAAYICRMTHHTKTDHGHTVVLACKEDGYYIWCGDSFISAGILMRKTNAISAAKRISKNAKEEAEVLKSYGSFKDKPCVFWSSKSCSHVNTILATIDESPSILDKLEEMYNGKSNTSVKNRDPEEMLNKFQFKKHIKLEGEKGSGKTTLALMFAKKIGAKVFFLGGNKSSEASDFIGEYIPMTVEVTSKGQKNLFEGTTTSQISMVWKDGKLAEAFRYAASGKKAIFIVDELLRIPEEESSPLVSALAPTPEGTLLLGTRRAVSVTDGIAKEEILECPQENLWVIATTNIGAAYTVCDMDEALADRLRTVRMDTVESQLRMVLKETALNNGYSISEVEPLIAFFNLYQRKRIDGAFKKICNQRHLKEALDCSIDARDIKETLWETRYAWIDTDIDGVPRVEQEEEVQKMLEKVYSAA